MLVLTRKPEETIHIGEGKEKIIITLLQVKGQYVRIGIEAPGGQLILRGELLSQQPREV